MYTYFLGVDVSKDTLDVALVDAAHQLRLQARLANTPEAIQAWFSHLATQLPELVPAQCLVCLEHTGIYIRPLLSCLPALGWPAWVEHAAQINACRGLVRGKTDKADAERIARYAARFQDRARLWCPTPPALAELRRLTTLRARLVQVLKILHTPVRGSRGLVPEAEVEATRQACAASVQALQADLRAAEQALDALVQGDAELARLYERVTSVPGIGPVTAREVLRTTDAFRASGDARHFASYAGVVPFTRSSGQQRGRPRVSPQANKRLKQLLHLAALTAVRYCPQLKAYYERKVAEGKSKLLVLNNVRNKLIHRLFACVRQDRNYQNELATTLA